MPLRHTLPLAFVLAAAAHAQIPLPNDVVNAPIPAADAKLPVYETVSIHENHGTDGMMRIMGKPNGFEAVNLPVKDLISQAYGLRQDLISGLPDWATTIRYDLNAKVADEDVPAMKNITGRQRGAMLLVMLQDRFHLQAHKETRQLPTYDLVIDKGGPKLPVSTAEKAPPDAKFDPEAKTRFAGFMMMGPGKLSATGIPMKSLINQLAYTTGRTVVDKTGLTANYDVELRWTPEGKADAGDDGSDDIHGDIFTALHDQLGLKLVPSKGPVETLVVDHIEKPTEN